jgi:four helix bundle protein
MDLVTDIYKLTARLPKYETYGISSQMQRSAVSIPSNIAEGSKRTRIEFRRFCSISYGSAAELETQLYIAQRLYAIDCSPQLELLNEIQKMLHVLMQKLEAPRHSSLPTRH